MTRMTLKTVLEYQSPRKPYVQCWLFRFIVHWTWPRMRTSARHYLSRPSFFESLLCMTRSTLVTFRPAPAQVLRRKLFASTSATISRFGKSRHAQRKTVPSRRESVPVPAPGAQSRYVKQGRVHALAGDLRTTGYEPG